MSWKPLLGKSREGHEKVSVKKVSPAAEQRGDQAEARLRQEGQLDPTLPLQ